jgi:predicted amidohydrolase
MRDFEQECAWQEIRRAFRGFQGPGVKPDIILLPELAVPRGRVGDLKGLARTLNSIVIAGVDYRLDSEGALAWNEAILIPVASGVSGKSMPPVWIGKTWAAPKEEEGLKSANWTFRGDPTLWLFRGGRTGDFGVSICYDLMDLERALLYRERVHHLFVLAYNKDTESFRHHAESLMRAMYCNVVICNTGFYGGSVAVAPFHTPFKRTIYRHDGASMVTSQLIALPLKELDAVQRGKVYRDFKSLPPCYSRK